MEKQLSGKKVLILVGNGVDEAVMSTVQREMLRTGATLKTAGIAPGLVNSWNKTMWGLYFPVDQQMSQTLGADYDFLVVPSGSRSIEKLALNAHSERIIASFITAGKPMAFMGDAVALLEKIGLAGTEKSANVISGDCTDISGFIASMAAHFAGEAQDVKVAA